MYLQLKLLNNYTEKSNISWQELDQMKRIYRKEHPLPDELYITKTEVLLAIIYKENAQLKTKLDMLQVIWIATTLSIIASWRKLAIGKYHNVFEIGSERAEFLIPGDFSIVRQRIRCCFLWKF